MRILGVDPGSQITGYGIVDFRGNRMSSVTSGAIRLGRGDMSRRLAQIFEQISVVVAEFEPDAAAIESVFVSRNPNSALKLGQARGAAICAMARGGMIIHEYSPATIKQTIVGGGRATKEQIAFMVKRLLGIRKELQEDEADALAIAVCHAHQYPPARSEAFRT